MIMTYFTKMKKYSYVLPLNTYTSCRRNNDIQKYLDSKNDTNTVQKNEFKAIKYNFNSTLK